MFINIPRQLTEHTTNTYGSEILFDCDWLCQITLLPIPMHLRNNVLLALYLNSNIRVLPYSYFVCI